MLDAVNQAGAVQLGIRDAHYVVSVTSWSPTPTRSASGTRTQKRQRDPVAFRVQADEEKRVDCYKAGNTIIYQIDLLLGEVEMHDAPTTEGNLQLSPIGSELRCQGPSPREQLISQW